MATRTTPVHDTALPLLKRINQGLFTKAKVARELNVLPQHVTNWLARGIPAARLHDVAALCGLSTDAYRREAGLPINAKAPKIDGDALTAAERELLEAFRAGTGRWRATVAHLLSVAPERQDEVADVILALVAKLADPPVPDAKVKQAFGVAAKRSSAKA